MLSVWDNNFDTDSENNTFLTHMEIKKYKK